MCDHNNEDASKIIITRKEKRTGKPLEIRINKDGKFFLNGELYDENKSRRRGIFMSAESYSRIETGEETQKMIEKSKRASKGETVVITDLKTPNRTQKTTVTF